MTVTLPPGPSGLQGNRDPIEMLTAFAAEYGDFVRYETRFGATTLVNDPDSIRQILFAPQDFPRSDVLGLALGDGLLASEGSLWHTQRRRYQPRFHPGALESYADVMAEEAEVTLEEWRGKEREGVCLELNEEMLRYSLRVASRLFLGHRVRSGPANDALCDATSRVVTLLGQMGNTLPKRHVPGEYRRQRIALGLLNRIIGQFIDSRRNIPPGDDLLGTLMFLKDEHGEPALDEKLLRDEVATMLLGGHETTSVALTWAMWELAVHRDHTDNLRDGEWRDVLGASRPGWGHLPRLKKTEATIRELLRLHPPVWSLVRKVARDADLAGFRIPAGENVIISAHLVHRRPATWTEPEVFNPARFEDGMPANVPRGAYIPFGAGPHTCIGQHFAMMELTIALPVLLREFRVVPDDPSEPGALPLVTLRPARPLTVRLERRGA